MDEKSLDEADAAARLHLAQETIISMDSLFMQSQGLTTSAPSDEFKISSYIYKLIELEGR